MPTAFKMPDDVYKIISKEAFERRMTMTELLRYIVCEYWDPDDDIPRRPKTRVVRRPVATA
jgi:hypothetical protein